MKFLPRSAALAALVLAGCGQSSSEPKKEGPHGPYPVQHPYVAPTGGNGGGGGMPLTADTSTGGAGHEVKKDPVQPVKPVDPPPAVNRGTSPGNDVLELVLKDSTGNTFQLSSFRGKSAVLVVFGATWCGNCAAALPALKAADGKYSGKGLVTAEIFLGDDADKAVAYAADKGMKHLLLLDKPQRSRGFYKWEVSDLPLHVLVGKDGKVVASGHAVPSDAEIEAALK